MKQLFIFILYSLIISGSLLAQETVYPAPAQTVVIALTGATIHVGNGDVIENGTLVFEKGKITAIGSIQAPQGATLINCTGKQVYPGLILSSTDLGLKEISGGVKGSNDYLELGEYNPSVRSLVAYNTDSKIIGTLRANGILLASITPEGGVLSGTSSVVQLDAWNWEDAAYKTDAGIHLNMPDFMVRIRRRGGAPREGGVQESADPSRQALNKIEEIKSFFRQAKAYREESVHKVINLKLEAVRNLFDRKQKLFIHADQAKQMLAAIGLVKEFGFDAVIVGGSESYLIAELLKQNNIAVILKEEHRLPATDDEDVDQPYRTPALLQKAGVLFALNDTHEESRYRNLMFNAGTAAAYGLNKEQALRAITLNAAKILGIEDKTGSLEIGKDANIVISDGDILDMKSSLIQYAFIQGRQVSLENKQTLLYKRYQYKYGIK